jgi:hypothetical protein
LVGDFCKKREEFAVSLRQRKKNAILETKRRKLQQSFFQRLEVEDLQLLDLPLTVTLLKKKRQIEFDPHSLLAHALNLLDGLNEAD